MPNDQQSEAVTAPPRRTRLKPSPPADESYSGVVGSTVKYLLRTEVHTFAFSVAANAILSFFPFVLLLMTSKVVNQVLNGKTKMGTDATAAAGPGATAASASDVEILTYGRAKGAFAGVSLKRIVRRRFGIWKETVRPNHHDRIRGLRAVAHLHRKRSDVSLRDSAGPFACAIAPYRKTDKQEIKNNKGCDVGLTADSEPVTVQSFAENKVHAVPSHEHGEKTDDAGDDQAKLRPPTGEASVQCCDVTKKRDERPRFLRIPAPESSPGIIRPDAA
jgi:hypothetical protein